MRRTPWIQVSISIPSRTRLVSMPGDAPVWEVTLEPVGDYSELPDSVAAYFAVKPLWWWALHWIQHRLGQYHGDVETAWLNDKLWVYFRCTECGQTSDWTESVFTRFKREV